MIGFEIYTSSGDLNFVYNLFQVFKTFLCSLLPLELIFLHTILFLYTFQHTLLAKFMRHSLKIQAWACCLIVKF
jgi:hypothetical protein